jgi:2-dehydro-3-deoxygluconokinase
MQRVAAIGECMLELRHRDEKLVELGFAGDSFNTALYMARCNRRERLTVDYVTALGDDPYSEAMLRSWREEGVGTDRVIRLKGKLPGLYFIRTDAAGERRFFYYRSAAAARELFRDAASLPLLATLRDYDVLYFTAITLSVLDSTTRERFHAALAAARAAGRLIAFDSNYRPAGWADVAAARSAIAPFLDLVGLALPTFEDEQALWGDATPADTLSRYAHRKIEVCVKLGSEGCLLGDGTCIPVPRRVVPVDTTAAGDAFNAAYLTARLAGHPAAEAARAGHILAATVIQHRGAIIPRPTAIPRFPGHDPG